MQEYAKGQQQQMDEELTEDTFGIPHRDPEFRADEPFFLRAPNRTHHEMDETMRRRREERFSQRECNTLGVAPAPFDRLSPQTRALLARRFAAHREGPRPSPETAQLEFDNEKDMTAPVYEEY